MKLTLIDGTTICESSLSNEDNNNPKVPVLILRPVLMAMCGDPDCKASMTVENMSTCVMCGDYLCLACQSRCSCDFESDYFTSPDQDLREAA